MGWLDYKRKTAILGIDIGKAAIKLLELSKSDAQYRVESYAVVPLAQEALADKNIANIDVISDAIKIALKQSETKTIRACVAIAGSEVMTQVISIPGLLSEAEIEEQMLVEADKLTPYTMDEVNLDFEIQGETENNPEMVDVLLVVSRRENVEDCIAVLEVAGLQASIVDVETFAIENAFSLLADPLPTSENHTVGVADSGNTMTLNVLHNGRTVYTHEQNFGGELLAEQIQTKQIIAQGITRSLKFFESSSTSRKIDSLVLAGGYSSISGLDKWVEQHMGIPAYVANPFINMTLSNKVNPQSLSYDAPAMLIACGLALRGFD